MLLALIMSVGNNIWYGSITFRRTFAAVALIDDLLPQLERAAFQVQDFAVLITITNWNRTEDLVSERMQVALKHVTR